MSAPFVGIAEVAGHRRLAMAGPDEPAEFFQFDVSAVMFTPIERGRRNGIVILYDSSQIGPGHGTQHRALVYRVGTSTAQRVPNLERRLEGATSAAEVRRRLGKVVR